MVEKLSESIEQTKSYETLMTELQNMIEQARNSDTVDYQLFKQTVNKKAEALSAAERESKIISLSRLSGRTEGQETPSNAVYFAKDTMPEELLAKFNKYNNDIVSAEDYDVILENLSSLPPELDDIHILRSFFLNEKVFDGVSVEKLEKQFSSQCDGYLYIIYDMPAERAKVFIDGQNKYWQQLAKEQYGVSIGNVLKPIVNID